MAHNQKPKPIYADAVDVDIKLGSSSKDDALSKMNV